MKQRDREVFVAMVRAKRAAGASMTDAVAYAYAWLLKPSANVWPKGTT